MEYAGEMRDAGTVQNKKVGTCVGLRRGRRSTGSEERNNTCHEKAALPPEGHHL
jgi:hypothetical protein